MSKPSHKGLEAHSTRPGSTRTRILLVDDDPMVRESLHDVFVSEGFAVVEAENGQQALELVNHSCIDVALLDLNMPVKGGWDTFEQLTREHPLIPVIIATAQPNQLLTAITAGAGALVEKPMDVPKLLQTIRKLLAETTEQRLARLTGHETNFHYRAPSTPCGDDQRTKRSHPA